MAASDGSFRAVCILLNKSNQINLLWDFFNFE